MQTLAQIEAPFFVDFVKLFQFFVVVMITCTNTDHLFGHHHTKKMW